MIINYKAGETMAKKIAFSKINVLRASVMGANDGIVSVAGIVIGVAGATSNNFAIFYFWYFRYARRDCFNGNG